MRWISGGQWHSHMRTQLSGLVRALGLWVALPMSFLILSHQVEERWFLRHREIFSIVHSSGLPSQRTRLPHPCRRARYLKSNLSRKRCQLLFHIPRPSRPYQFRTVRLECWCRKSHLHGRRIYIFLFIVGRRARSIWYCELMSRLDCDAAQLATTRKHLTECHLWCQECRASVY